MKFLIALSLITFSVAAFSGPECEYWKTEAEVLEVRVEKVEAQIRQCENKYICRDLKVLKQSLKDQRSGYLSNLELFCE